MDCLSNDILIIQHPDLFWIKPLYHSQLYHLALVNLQADRARDSKLGEPIILLNPNNRACLQLQGAVSETKKILTGAIRNEPDLKVDFDKLDEAHAVIMAGVNTLSRAISVHKAILRCLYLLEMVYNTGRVTTMLQT